MHMLKKRKKYIVHIPFAKYVCRIITSNYQTYAKIIMHYQIFPKRVRPDYTIQLIHCTIDSYYFHIDPKTCISLLYIPVVHIDGFDEIYCIKCIIATYFIHKGFLFLHASAVNVCGKTLIFLGESGAGKSTISQLSGEPIIGDDEVLIGVQHQVAVYQSPFEKAKEIDFSGHRYSFGSMYILRQSDHTVIEELKLSLLDLHRLLTYNLYNNKFLASSAVTLRRRNLLVSKLLKRMPMHIIHFENDTNAVRKLWIQ